MRRPEAQTDTHWRSAAVFWPLLSCVIVQALVTASALSVAVMAPVLATVLNVDTVTSGIYIALIYLLASLGSGRAGKLLMHIGPLRLAVLSLLLASVGACLMLVGNLFFAVLAALVAGLGYGLTSPASSEWLARVTAPGSRALVFSIKQAGVPLGGMLAGLAIPALLTLSLFSLPGWQTALVVVVVIDLLVAASLLFLWRRHPDKVREQRSAGAATSFRGLFANKTLQALTLSSFFFAGFQLAVSAYLVLHLVEEIGFELALAGVVFSISQASGIFGRFVWGWLADYFGANRAILTLVAAGMAIFGFAALVLGEGSSLTLVTIVAIGLGATTNAWTGIYMAELVRGVPSDQAGAITGTAMTITFAGVVVGPPLFGLASMIVGSYAAGYGLFALCCLVSAIRLMRS